ncbi:MAG: plasmid pRiA4b family protein [Ferruginibacter sp.]|nr:plasmid pRiA4b family protein [Ferruginibacter sp.]
MKEIVQLTISLQHSNPLIWRTILVKKETTFFELHQVIQIAMGWKNYHLFEFNLDGYRVGIIDENDQPGCRLVFDAIKTRLADIVSFEADSFLYNYDFGDGWLHEITIEQVIEKEEHIIYPTCVDGQLNCPPEDCGGLNGYYNMLPILQDKEHPEYKETKIWVGKKYNPESFNKSKINKRFGQMRKYISG